MYQELTDEELKLRLTKLNVYFNNGTNTAKNMMKLFFEEIHRTFPLKDVMPDDFKGNHSLTLNETGKLQLNIWCNDTLYTITEN